MKSRTTPTHRRKSNKSSAVPTATHLTSAPDDPSNDIVSARYSSQILFTLSSVRCQNRLISQCTIVYSMSQHYSRFNRNFQARRLRWGRTVYKSKIACLNMSDINHEKLALFCCEIDNSCLQFLLLLCGKAVIKLLTLCSFFFSGEKIEKLFDFPSWKEKIICVR